MISTMVTTMIVGTIFMCGLILVFFFSSYYLFLLYMITVTTKLALVLSWLLLFLVQ